MFSSSLTLGAVVKIPEAPPPLQEVLEALDSRSASRVAAHQVLSGDQRYLHWDEVRRRTPPDGLSHDQWWAGMKLARLTTAKLLPLADASGNSFWVSSPDPLLEGTHFIDRYLSGRIDVPDEVTTPGTRDRYLVSSLEEEAITSSLLEGAHTTRKAAKQMLQSGRRPENRGELMVFNNFQAMDLARELATEELTPERVFELHRTVTDGTLDDPATAGRLQHPDEERIRIFWDRGHRSVLLHDPPPAEQLPRRMEALCDFANEVGDTGFLHPVVRSILLHFWIGYDHPFVDGNGRTARALFYWSMLRQGYWLTQFLSISSILRQAPAKYVRSYLFTETDERDATYFVVAQLRVLRQAIDALNEYIAKKTREVRAVEAAARGTRHFNHRQLDIIGVALRDPHARFTFRSHARRHDVVYQSARTDLIALEELGLLEREKVGRQYIYFPAADLETRLQDL